MYIENPSSTYGFCPGKATWDPHIADIYNSLIITAYTGQFLHEGGIEDQPYWYAELLGWFLISYDNARFYSRAKSVLGDSKKLKPVGGTGRTVPTMAGRQLRKR